MKILLLKLIDILMQLYGAARGRPLIYVRIVEDEPNEEAGGLRFEVENRRRSVTSLDPKIAVTYHFSYGKGVRRGTNTYYVREVDRRLEPFRPIILTASADQRLDLYLHSWYRTYRFRPTSGLKTRVHVRNCLLQPLGRSRFLWELTEWRIFGRVRSDEPHSLGDDERMRCAQGPH